MAPNGLFMKEAENLFSPPRLEIKKTQLSSPTVSDGMTTEAVEARNVLARRESQEILIKLLVFVRKQVAWLAFQLPADRFQCGEADSLGLAGFED